MKKKTIVDLSVTYIPGMLAIGKFFYEGAPDPFQIEVLTSVIGGQGMLTEKVHMLTHSGSHIDAPRHFIPGRKTIDEVPLEQLVGNALVFDLTYKKDGEDITAEDLETAYKEFLDKGIALEPGDKILLATGFHNRVWGEKGSRDYWAKSPRVAKDASEWFLKKEVSAVGFDFFQGGPVWYPDGSRISRPREEGEHYLVLNADMCNIEYLCNLEKIKGKKVFLVALPLKIKGGSGAPSRVIAIVEE